MGIEQSFLKKAVFHRLKCLNQLEIEFPIDKRLVAIMGPNGCGKSTILHALACVNKPTANGENHKYCDFFTPTSNNRWIGSSFEITQDSFIRNNFVQNHITHFRKANSRWLPYYDRRQLRFISYVGVNGSVPQIELEKKKSLIRFNQATILNDQTWNHIRSFVGQVLNRNYDEVKQYVVKRNKSFLGVKTNGVEYSGLSMGAGEQRVFQIAKALYRAEKGGLVLIEEIELLLHQDALIRMLNLIRDIAYEKKLQVIFTSHSPCVLTQKAVAVRYIFQTPEKTLCLNQVTDEALRLLTGEQQRPLKIYCEDILAKQLVSKVASQLGIRKSVEVFSFGSGKNVFTLACGLVLKGESIEDSLFVLDGDVFRTEQEKRTIVDGLIVGNSPEAREHQANVLSHIRQFVIDNDIKPEFFYNTIIRLIPDNQLTEDGKEIRRCAGRIINPGDSHQYLDDIVRDLGLSEEVGLCSIVDVISRSDRWADITANIREWLISKKEKMGL